jgi:hypothetical protein
MSENRSSSPPLRVSEWIFRAVVFLVALSTAKATQYALTNKTAFLEAFPGATEGVYLLFVFAGVLGFVALVGLFYFQRWATWLFGILALLITILNLGTSAPMRHTLASIAVTVIILGLGVVCRERFR